MPFVSNHMEEVGVSSFREKQCKRLWLLLEKDRRKIKTKLGFSGLERPRAAALEGTAGIAFNRQFNLFYHCI